LKQVSAFGENVPKPGMPDGIFSYQKYPIWVHFGRPWIGKCMYAWAFCNCMYGYWYIFHVRVYILYQEKSGTLIGIAI
jgi:hypothetical protein